MDTSLLYQLASSNAAMEMIYTIVWVVGTVSFLVFIALFGRLPVFRKTPIGWTHRLLAVHLPASLIYLDTLLTNRRISTFIIRTYNYLVHDRHPVVLIIFVTLQAGSEILFLPPASPYLSSVHKYFLIPVLIANPYFWLYLSYATSAHHITPASYPAALTRYPYDYTLYHPHQPCRSCSQRPKPARSKHCSICKTCIERQDHHCVWINNCVGLHNYGYFVALLLSTAGLLGYGAVTGLKILNTILQNAFIPRNTTTKTLKSQNWSTGLSWGEWLNIYSIAIASNARLGATTLLAFMTFPLALGFLVYHAYLIWAGTTTNETAKWTDLREDIWDKLVWQAKITEVKAEYPGPLEESIVYDPNHHLDQSRRNGKRPLWPDGEAREARWWIIRTKGGAPPTRWRNAGEGRHEEIVDERWMRVRNLKEVENFYDLGIRRNFKDAFFRAKRVKRREV